MQLLVHSNTKASHWRNCWMDDDDLDELYEDVVEPRKLKGKCVINLACWSIFLVEIDRICTLYIYMIIYVYMLIYYIKLYPYIFPFYEILAVQVFIPLPFVKSQCSAAPGCNAL